MVRLDAVSAESLMNLVEVGRNVLFAVDTLIEILLWLALVVSDVYPSEA